MAAPAGRWSRGSNRTRWPARADRMAGVFHYSPGAAMPSFDIVSEFDKHEASNTVDQANREVQSRFDFKGVDASFALEGDSVKLEAEVDFQLKQGLDQKEAKDIVKRIKESKLKVQAQIQGEKVRVTGKKRDDLQAVMALLRGEGGPDLPLQFDNFRD